MDAIAVVVVNFNTRDLLRRCLETVVAQCPAATVVVDNASTDGSAAMVRAEFPSVALLVNTTNPGYGGASNQGIAACGTDNVLLLNSDTRLEPGALEALAGYIDRHPRAAVIGPRLSYPDGSLQATCYAFPSPLDPFLHGRVADRLFRIAPGPRDRYLRTWSHDHARPVPWVMGAALAIRRQAFDAVGGFDHSFFMYAEEIDLCYRLARAGWEIHFAPVTTVVHVKGASTGQQRVKMEVRLIASITLFYRRHYPRHRVLLWLAVVRTLALLRLLRDVVRVRAVRDIERRHRIGEDLRVWREILRGAGGGPPGSAGNGAHLDRGARGN